MFPFEGLDLCLEGAKPTKATPWRSRRDWVTYVRQIVCFWEWTHQFFWS